MSLDWPVNPLADSILPDPHFFLMFPAANNNSVLFQLLYTPAGDRMLFKHNRRYHNVLQGWSLPFRRLAMYLLLGTPAGWWDLFSPDKGNREFKLKYLKRLLDNNNIFCLQEVHGKDEFLQAIQVLVPRFRLSGTFPPDNENAGGSAICIHMDLLLEEAIVSHVVTCQGRDHLVNVPSGRHILVFVNVHFEPELGHNPSSYTWCS